MRFLSSSAEYRSGWHFLTNRLAGPGHRVEAGTVRKLKVSIVADKDRIPVLAGTFGRAACRGQQAEPKTASSSPRSQ